MAPSIVDQSGSNFTDAGATDTTASLTWQAGDIIVVLGTTEDNSNTTYGTPTATGLTFAALAGTPTNTASSCKSYAWSATAAADGSSAVSATSTGASHNCGIRAWVTRGGTVGTPAVLVSTSKTNSLTRVGTDSIVLWIGGDWSADTDVTVTADPASNGTVRDAANTANYTAFTADWTTQGAPGTTSYGVANASGTGNLSKIAVEVYEVPAGIISHDAMSENSATDATSFTADTSWTHTPVGTPKAVVVCITQPLSSADEVSGVTYGGVGMSRRVSQARTVTEQMRVYIYDLYASIPTGAQTVAVTLTTQTAAAKHGMVFTATVSGANYTIINDASNSSDLGIIANPSITVTHTGTLSGWAGYAAHGYGAAAPVTTGLQTGETYQAGHDPGAAVAMVYTRHGGADAASSTYGYTTLASDDQVIAAVVLKGVAPAGPAATTPRPAIPPYAALRASNF